MVVLKDVVVQADLVEEEVITELCSGDSKGDKARADSQKSQKEDGVVILGIVKRNRKLQMQPGN